MNKLMTNLLGTFLVLTRPVTPAKRREAGQGTLQVGMIAVAAIIIVAVAVWPRPPARRSAPSSPPRSPRSKPPSPDPTRPQRTGRASHRRPARFAAPTPDPDRSSQEYPCLLGDPPSR